MQNSDLSTEEKTLLSKERKTTVIGPKTKLSNLRWWGGDVCKPIELTSLRLFTLDIPLTFPPDIPPRTFPPYVCIVAWTM